MMSSAYIVICGSDEPPNPLLIMVCSGKYFATSFQLVKLELPISKMAFCGGIEVESALLKALISLINGWLVAFSAIAKNVNKIKHLDNNFIHFSLNKYTINIGVIFPKRFRGAALFLFKYTVEVRNIIETAVKCNLTNR